MSDAPPPDCRNRTLLPVAIGVEAGTRQVTPTCVY